MYIHQNQEWPNFKWDHAALNVLLAELRHKQGILIGRMSALGFQSRMEASLDILTTDIVKSSAIEGEVLDILQVRSSIAKRLGIDIAGTTPASRDIEGIVEIMLDATQNYNAPLTEDRLFGWHCALFPTGRSGLHRIAVGNWRTEKVGAMQVVSGAYGREKVHFEAPSASILDQEMFQFLSWFNRNSPYDTVIKAAIAHLYFVTIHPFEDGNGRIGRAIADMALTRSDKSQQRFYSMSSQIEKERSDYYDCLETTQKGHLDITEWLLWFLQCLERAITSSEYMLEHILKKSALWKYINKHSINDRQKKIINLLIEGFEGKLTTSKYGKITKCSQDTALRDIRDLIDKHILEQSPEGGRSTSYNLCDSKAD